MRFIVIAWTAAATLIIGLAAPVAAAQDAAVKACVSSSAYLDGEETFKLCDKARGLPGVAGKDLSEINRQIGEAYYFAFRPAYAIPFLDEAIRLDPGSGQAFRRRGWSHWRHGNFSAAVADFTDFLALSPNDADAQFALAFIRYEETSDCAAAAKEYERILARHPDHYLTRRALAGRYACIDGHGMRQLQELNKLVAAGRKAIADTNYFGRQGRADRDFYSVVIEERAGIYYDTNQWREAEADYTWLIDNYPFNLPPIVNRAKIRNVTGDASGALLDADATLAMQPHFVDAQIERLKALNALKRNDETIAFANSVLAHGQITPLTAKIHFFRAIAYKRLGHRSEAHEDFYRSLAASEGIAWAMHMHLGNAGYLFSPYRDRTKGDGGPPLDFGAKEFTNAMTACLLDPECLK